MGIGGTAPLMLNFSCRVGNIMNQPYTAGIKALTPVPTKYSRCGPQAILDTSENIKSLPLTEIEP
jgi:hypothetical protein